jgi:hypothetical protein
MKTAMQELLLKLATQTEKDSFGRRIIQLSIVDKEIVEALEKEKEQIKNDFTNGQLFSSLKFEEYFKNEYQKNK